jgi:protein TonB
MQPDPAPRPERRLDPVPTSPDRRYMASANVPGPALAVPGDAGAGGLLLPAPEIPGAAPGPRVGTGVARGSGDGLTSFARPVGGYQTTPRYPEAARREGAEGVVTLRFEVLTSGKVGTVQIQRSTGRRDLDRAAMEAVKTWLFEPARRGKEAVAVWVILPVRFELNAR